LCRAGTHRGNKIVFVFWIGALINFVGVINAIFIIIKAIKVVVVVINGQPVITARRNVHRLRHFGKHKATATRQRIRKTYRNGMRTLADAFDAAGRHTTING
jgi:hypothetical protein